MIGLSNRLLVAIACLVVGGVFLYFQGDSMYDKSVIYLTGKVSSRITDALKENPDSIPHSITGIQNCLTCHKDGKEVCPHPDRKNCTDCHKVESNLNDANDKPDLIPHSLTGRENCLSCHKSGEETTPHPDRKNCTECHKVDPNQKVS